MTSKILITGIAGLLGSHFSRYLLDKGYEVIGIDNFFGGFKENLAPGIYCKNLNLENLEELEKFIKKEKPEYIYHFAAYAAKGLSPFIRKFNYTQNLICSANVITSAINNNVEKVIFTSSMSVYGGEPPFNETMQPDPWEPYGIAKYATELDLKTANAQFGLNYSIVRPHNVIGIYQNIWDKYRNVIGIWIRQAINNEPITVFGDGLQTRAFSDVNFYNEPFEKLMTKFNKETFNLGADKEITILEAAQMVQKCAKNFGFNPQIKFLEARHEQKYAFSNHNKAKKMLNFKDDTNLEDVIYKMFEWAIKQPKRKIKRMVYETEKRIYSFWK